MIPLITKIHRFNARTSLRTAPEHAPGGMSIRLQNFPCASTAISKDSESKTIECKVTVDVEADVYKPVVSAVSVVQLETCQTFLESTNAA